MDIGFHREILMEERLNLFGYKNNYSKAERRDRGFCARIINGRTLENLGRVYESSDSSLEEYALTKRFVEYFEKQKKQPLENISAEEVKQITLGYIKKYYPKDNESITKSKDLVKIIKNY